MSQGLLIKLIAAILTTLLVIAGYFAQRNLLADKPDNKPPVVTPDMRDRVTIDPKRETRAIRKGYIPK